MSRLMFKIFAFVVIAILAIVASAKNGALRSAGAGCPPAAFGACTGPGR